MRIEGGTIVALSSGALPSGVAVVRISGPAAPKVAAALSIEDLTPRRAALRTLRAADGVIDTALCLAFTAPASATGEDVLELHCHGSPAVVDRLLAEAVAVPGVRLAAPGEFTLRAVLSGKMGLTEAEALADLIDARTEAERRRAVRLAGGALTRAAADVREATLTALALCEAHIDFSDESDVPDGTPAVDSALRAIAGQVSALLAGAIDADKLYEGFHVVLVGAPNAGKSSLLNAIAGRSVAIVSDEAGTTRDVVTLTVDLGGYRTIISDTAGLRAGAEGIEALGISRTRTTVAGADFVVEVRSADTAAVFDGAADVVVSHKADVAPVAGDLSTSVSDPESIDRLTARLAEAAARHMARAETALVTRARQREVLEAARLAVENALSAQHLEVKAEGIRGALQAVAQLTGEVGVEDVLDRVFSRFCIGK
ncbi:MAG: tRNA uridine-5-carboxymethylaminomethyl(34) synthesis GTPase MnmE [Pseudomonadota bacterium]